MQYTLIIGSIAVEWPESVSKSMSGLSFVWSGTSLSTAGVVGCLPENPPADLPLAVWQILVMNVVVPIAAYVIILMSECTWRACNSWLKAFWSYCWARLWRTYCCSFEGSVFGPHHPSAHSIDGITSSFQKSPSRTPHLLLLTLLVVRWQQLRAGKPAYSLRSGMLARERQQTSTGERPPANSSAGVAPSGSDANWRNLGCPRPRGGLAKRCLVFGAVPRQPCTFSWLAWQKLV